MKFPNKCCQCGFCCLVEQCPISIEIYGSKKTCPALTFQNDKAICKHIDIVPIGDGCCIKARAYKNGIKYDFALLPKELKINAAQNLRKIPKWQKKKI